MTIAGFVVQLSRSGAEALRLFATMAPTCVVIDIRLPDMSGWDLCRQIQQRPATRIPVIVLTQDISRPGADAGRGLGCSAWLAQPASASHLVASVRHVLRLERHAPRSPADALLDGTTCPQCGAARTNATIRIGDLQYYRCQACPFWWRTDTR